MTSFIYLFTCVCVYLCLNYYYFFIIVYFCGTVRGMMNVKVILMIITVIIVNTRIGYIKITDKNDNDEEN